MEGGADLRALTEPDEDDLLDYAQVAALWGVSVSLIKTLKAQNRIPYVLLPATEKAGRARDGRLVRFRRADLREVVASWRVDERIPK